MRTRDGWGAGAGPALARATLAGASVSVVSCGLALGINDIPPVPGIADAGAHDAHVVDATRDTGVDAGVDAAPDVVADAAPVGLLPPRTGTQTSSTTEVNFAFHQLWLGDTAKDSTFTPDPSAWSTFGYNIDGKVTTSVSTDVCTLSSNAATTVQIDGHDGADNSFGENIISLLSFAFNGLSQDLTSRIEKGSFTLLLDTRGLTTDPTQTNVGLSAQFFGGSRLGTTPTFTPADNWPVDPTTLADGVSLANGSKISVFDSYVTGGTWVSGHPTDFVFSLAVGGVPVALLLHQAIITFQHTVDDAGASHAVSGMVAGILKPSEILGALDVAAASSGGTYCAQVGVLDARFLAAQDIMQDGSNTPGQPCNAISAAFAFTADEIQPPSVVGPAPPVNDGSVPTCALDAGDAASD
jgi:hypothetical protein